MLGFIFRNLKLFSKKIIFFLKSSLFLDSLNKNEIEGNIENLTFIKFIKKTPLKVPFSLGRTARGCSFDNNLVQDPFFNVFDQISQNKPLRDIKDYLSEAFKIERK